jgi:hypothetical protein
LRSIAVAKKKTESSPSKLKKSPRGAVVKPSKIANAQVAGGSMTEENKRTGSAPAAVKVGLSSEAIGHAAGDVWKVLADRGEQTVAGLKKAVDSPDELVVAALGWLARENKVSFATNGRSVTVSLL